MKILMSVLSAMVAAISVFADTRTVDGVEYVYLLKDGKWSDAKKDASYWSDGEVPGTGKNYLVADGRTLALNVLNDTFPGASLRIGDQSGSGFVSISSSITIPSVVCSAGWIDVDASVTLTGTTMTILSKADAPFAFRGDTVSTTATYQLFLRMRVSGAADAVFALTSKDQSIQGTGKGVTVFFTSLDGTFKPAGNPMNEYFGKIVVDGLNVRLGLEWNSGNDVGDGVLGADSGSPVPDAITLRNGGGIYLKGGYSYRISLPNRGVTVDETTGGRISADGGVKRFNFQISGGGPLSLSSTHRLLIGNPMPKVSSVTVEAGSIYADETTEPWSDIDVVLLGGTLVTPAAGFCPKSLDYRGGSVLAGVANGASPFGDKNQLVRPVGDDVGLVVCSAASSIVTTPIAMDVEADIPTVLEGRYELLRLPTTVKKLAASDVSIADRTVTIETTADGIQHVYAGFKTNSCAYVVPMGTPGVVPTAPYASWATAATNFTDAIAAATAGGCVYVKPGTYNIYDTEPTHTVTLNKNLRIRSDDGTGKLATDLTILDGQSKTRLVDSTATACCIEGLTFSHAQASGIGAAVRLSKSDSAQIVVRGCVFNDNVAANGQGVLGLNDSSSKARVEGCAFLRNTCWNSTTTEAPGALFFRSASVDAALGATPYVRDCVFADNIGFSGAIFGAIGATAWIENCHFTNNYGRATVNNAISKDNARKSAGAVSVSVFSVIVNSTFVGNDGDSAAVEGTGRLVGCLIESNAGYQLEKVTANSGSAANRVMERCRVIGNMVNYFKPMTGKEAWHLNCIFANNTFTDGLFYFAASYPGTLHFENCTLVSNAVNQIVLGTPAADSGLALTNTVFAFNAVKRRAALPSAGVFAGGYNFTDDETIAGMTASGLVAGVEAKFVDAENGDYRLKFNSPLREAGTLLDWMADTTDLDGNPRVLDRRGKISSTGLPDIGCFECALPTPGLMLILR